MPGRIGNFSLLPSVDIRVWTNRTAVPCVVGRETNHSQLLLHSLWHGVPFNTRITLPNLSNASDCYWVSWLYDCVCLLTIDGLRFATQASIFWHWRWGNLLSQNVKIKIHRTTILPVVHGCESWPFTLREQRWLRMFENRLLRRIFGLRRTR